MTKRFLITGVPRMRSAWLAALFSGDGVECWHDSTPHGGAGELLGRASGSEAEFVGICDPCAACVYPREALEFFRGSPIIVIRRKEAESRAGLIRWAGREPSDWDALMRNHAWFIDHIWANREPKPAWVQYEDLDDYDVVSSMYAVCTDGKRLSANKFELFDSLRIEQHLAKVALTQ
jgi:hypothetical protein